jgi:hypothetical protein
MVHRGTTIKTPPGKEGLWKGGLFGDERIDILLTEEDKDFLGG